MYDARLPSDEGFSRSAVDLCIAVAATDGLVSSQEIGFVFASLRRRLGIIADDALYEYLQDRVKSPGSTLRALSSLAPYLTAYPGSAFIIAALMADLVRKDGITPEEREVFRLVVSGLSLGKNAQTAFLWTLSPAAERTAVPVRQVWDLAAPKGLTACLCQGVVWVLPVDDDFLVFPERLDAPLFLDDQELSVGEISLATKRSMVRSGISQLSMALLAEVASQEIPVSRRWGLTEARASYRFCPAPAAEKSNFMLTLAHGDFVLELDDSLDPTRLLGAGWVELPAAGTRKYAGKADSRFLGPGADFSTLDLWAPGSLASVGAEAISDQGTFVIGDLPGAADVVVDSGLDLSLRGKLRIEVGRRRIGAGWSFTVRPTRLPTAAALDHTPLVEGRVSEISENGYLVVGNASIELDARSGSITRRAIVIERLDVEHLSYRFKDGKSGTDDVTFSVRRGQMVAIMGPSGSGKSTLLKLLLGIVRPTSGAVRVNEEDLHEHYAVVRSRIGYVPQDDLLYDNLTVYENMIFAARLRLPLASRKDIEVRIDEALQAVSLSDKKHLRVGDVVNSVLSGGQRKRLNIAQELIVKPDLFFLDEPTSGLSSRDSQLIIRNLKGLSDAGTIIFVVIHQPSSELYRLFDQVAILDVGGRLSFFGPPVDSVRYFNEQGGNEGEAVCAHCGHIEPERIFSVMERSSLTGQRQMRPEDWKQLFNIQRGMHTAKSTKAAAPSLPLLAENRPARGPHAWLSRTGALIARSFLERLKDPVQAVLTFAAPLVLGIAMAALMKEGGEPYAYCRNPDIGNYFFLTIVVFILLGLMGGIGEVIKDRPKHVRERLLDVRPLSYLASKTLPFLLFNIVQVLMYEIAGFIILGIPTGSVSGAPAAPGPTFAVCFFFVGFVCSWASFALSLLLSALLKTQAAAFAVIPLILIPQILLGGLFLPFSSMARMDHEEVPWYANLMFARWGYEALASGQEIRNPIYQLTNGTAASFDERAIVIDRLKADQPMDPPRRVSYGLYNDLLAKTPDPAKERDALLHRMYALNDKGTLYLLRAGVSDEDRAAFRRLASSVDNRGFMNGYVRLSYNDHLFDQIFSAQSVAWLDRIENAPTSWKPIDFLPSTNVYPANKKIFGPIVTNTVTYDLIVLLALGLLCTGLFLLIFGKGKRS